MGELSTSGNFDVLRYIIFQEAVVMRGEGLSWRCHWRLRSADRGSTEPIRPCEGFSLARPGAIDRRLGGRVIRLIDHGISCSIFA